jgi:hypothetical protein
MRLMKRKERFMAALSLQEPDRVPMFDFLFQQPMYRELIGRWPEDYNGRDAIECALALDHDGVWLPFGDASGSQPKFLADNVYVDEWGTVYQKNNASWNSRSIALQTRHFPVEILRSERLLTWRMTAWPYWAA